jgi:hypothetical protein
VWKGVHFRQEAPLEWRSLKSQVLFTAAQLWGAISPARFLGRDTPYSDLYYFFAIGAILPVIFFYLSKRFPGYGIQYVRY